MPSSPNQRPLAEQHEEWTAHLRRGPGHRDFLDYGRDRSYGHVAEAEIRELLTHVPVGDGKPGVLHASRTLNADQSSSTPG